MITPQQPKLWGYCRASTDLQKDSPDIQEAQLRQRWAVGDMDGEPAEIFKEHRSAVDLRYDERPAFIRLMHVVQAGDHLFVTHLDRIDRNPFGLMRAAEWLQRRDVHLHVLNFPGRG